MKNVFSSQAFIKMASLLIVCIVLVSWQPGNPDTASNKSRQHYAGNTDTSAPKSTYIDQADLQLNLDSVMQQVNIAMSKIDFTKMNVDVQKAMAQVDYTKINSDINTAMKNIDWNTMKLNVSLALDSAKMAIDKINWNEIKADIDKAQIEARKEMAKQKINNNDIQAEVQKAMKEAQKSLQAVKIEMASYKGLIHDLQRDGLIDTTQHYQVQLKDGDLYLNGIKQKAAVTEKYKKYYENKKNFTIGNNGHDDDKEADL